MSAKITGTVKKYSDKGFGFIRRDDDDQDVFIHHTVVAAAGLRELAAGDRVEFTIVASDRGPRANTVRLVD